MAEEYARVLARVAAGQLAEIAGYEAVQESAVEILADLLLHYLSELSTGANAYANLASRSDINVNDVALAIEDLGTSVEELGAYASSLNSDDNTFVHSVPHFPVRRPSRAIPTFEEKDEQPPSHVPAFLPAFPDPHTFEHTPAFPGHELNPQKQTEVVQQQRRAAEKALVQLHKRAKPSGSTAPATAVPAAGAKATGATASERMGPDGDSSFLNQPLFGDPGSGSSMGHGLSASTSAGADMPAREGVLQVPGQLLLGTCPHHIVFDRSLAIRQLGPTLEAVLPVGAVQLDSTKLTEAFEVVHPAPPGTCGIGVQPLDSAAFTRNPFQTFVLRSRQSLGDGAQPLQLQGNVISAQLRLRKRPLPGVPQAAPANGGAGPAAGSGEAGAAPGPGVLGEPEELLLFLAAPRAATDEQLQAMHEEAEMLYAQSQSAAGKRRLDGSRTGTKSDPAATDAAFRALIGGESEVAWKCTSHFEDNGGPLKPTFAAGFSQDWATATRRAALALASRREQEDAYKDLQQAKV